IETGGYPRALDGFLPATIVSKQQTTLIVNKNRFSRRRVLRQELDRRIHVSCALIGALHVKRWVGGKGIAQRAHNQGERYSPRNLLANHSGRNQAHADQRE